MKILKSSIIILLVLINITLICAVIGVTQTDIFYDASTLNPVTGVQEIIYTCGDLSCSSQGNLIHNLNTGNSNSITFEYPYNPSSTQNNPDYYSHFSFAECYLPKEYKEWVWGYGASVEYDYHMNKAEDCHSPIDSFSVTNDNHVNEPVVINVKANLEANAYSAFTDLQLNWFPEGYKDYYSAETRVTLQIFDSSDNLVYQDYEDLNILMDTSENVQFTWTPTEEDEYKAIVKTSVIDCQCESGFEQSASKIFTVWAERPEEACYTIINDLTATPQFAKEGDLVTITFNKISNYVDSNYNKTPTPTKVYYEIKNELGNIVFSENSVLDANPDPVNPKEISFQWTPDEGGEHIIKVTGVAKSTLCCGKTNPEDTSILNFFVQGNLPEAFLVNFIVKDSDTFEFLQGASVDFDGETKTTDSQGETYFEVEEGTYSWQVSKSDYESKSGNVQVEKDITLNVELDKLCVTCYTNEDCGINGFIGNTYCKCGDVWKDFIKYLCNLPGTPNSYCSNKTTPKLFEECEFGCEQGACLPECKVNSDCGEPYYGEKYCQGNDVVRDSITPICNNGVCSTETETQIVEECDSDEKCENGECVKDNNGKKGKSNKFTNLFFECVPIWECSDWSDCYEEIKTRNCEDINNCEVVIDKPLESVGCQEEITESALEEPTNKLWILMGVLIALILILFLVWLGWR